MVQELRLFRFVDGVNDTPFPNKEANDEQIVITSFSYNAQRMAATPTITASIDYYRCLDDDWDVNVYAEYKGEKYYIRQIPSSSKSNTSVMYKHDLTLYSERFILENIYFTDIEKKTENGVDVFVKRETTSITYRFNLIEYVDRLNWSLEASNLPYRVSIDSSILNSDKAKEIKDVSLENAYLANAIQEIYNQWETFFYFNGNNIVIKDCSENINDVVLEYGAENSLLSIKKNNANFRKITRISGYGSDKNIPFYYPNWSQKGVIDAMPLSTNSKLTKGMITIADMKKFDKKMPLNGNVKYFLKSETQPIFSDTTLNKDGLKYQNQTSTKQTFSIPFETIRENDSVVDIYFDVDIYEEVFPTINNQYLYYDIYEASGSQGIQVLADMLHSPVDFGGSFLVTKNKVGKTIAYGRKIPCTATLESSEITSTMNIGTEWKGRLSITRKLRICLTCQSVPKGEYDINVVSSFNIAEAIKKQEKIGYYIKNYGSIAQREKDYFATLNQDKNIIDIKLSNFSVVFPESDADEGWYLNETKKIDLADIGISINGTPDDTWNGEGFTQEMVSKIPTAQNLMPSLYRNSIGERKFYNAINYPRSAGANDQDGESGEMLNGLMYENENYKVNDSYYNFETLWTPTNQNEHIQDFEDIYPSITNVTNANNEPIDEILEVAFDDNDNNEVDEEGNYIHPYFYVRIPKFDGNNGFNLFDHKIVGGNMQVAMTSGDCAACNFEIMVKTRTSQGNDTYEDVVNPIKLKENGTLVDGDSDKKTAGDFGTEDATQQDSRNNSIWLVLKKDNQTFNEAYPNKLKGVVPKVGDKFVLLNIDMPRSYVLEAEEKLTKEIVKYMSQNNSDKWNFDIDFSRIFLQENQEFYSKLDENCKLNVRYNGVTYNFYVNNYKYEVKSNEALPKITVGLVDTITINRGVTQNVVDGVMKAIQQTYDVEEGLDYDALYFRKSVPETITHKTTFDDDVDVNGNLNVGEIKLKKLQSPMYGGSEISGIGFQLKEDENGESTLTVDNVNVRKKLKATEFVIQQIQFQGGIVIQSAAAMECNNVERLENGNFKCYFDTKNGSVSNQFMLDDLARCQRVGYAPKYYWRKVVEIGSDYIVLSNVVGEYEEGSDVPSAGDIIVQMGNTTNTNRQSAIEMNTVGENSPSFIMYSGITTFSLLEKDTTGIVYHQKVVDENGNVTIEAYPELYSYGSMYFGDRNKQNNFIQFAPNANGTFEMLINAKTSFQGGTSDLGNALDSLLNGVQGAQNTANSADSKATQAQNTANTANSTANSANTKATQAQTAATNAQNSINNLKIGGTNLLLKSDEIVENETKYLAKGYTYAKQPTIGTYTVQIKGVLGEDRTHWDIYTKKGYYLIINVTANDLINGIYTKTFNFTEATIGADDFLLYQRPSTGTSGSYIEWVKLEEGNKPTSWSPAPEDVEQAIADAEDRTMEALANEVETINGGIEALQKQVDGEVTSWFLEGAPTLTNAPAKDWTTDEEKLRHEGDTYTDITTFVDSTTTPTAGQSWRWCNVDDEYGTGWHWHKIADSDAVKALAEAGKAQATADGKSTTFVVQPSNYSKGDLWILASDTNVNGTTYKSGTILTANEASTTYVASHWGEKVKYTDDTVAQEAIQKAQAAFENVEQAIEAVDTVKDSVDTLNDELTKSLADGYISKDEQERLRQLATQIDTDFSALVAEYDDVRNSNYLSATDKRDLLLQYEYTSECYDNYYYALSDIISIGSVDMPTAGIFSGKVKIKIDTITGFEDWSYEDFMQKSDDLVGALYEFKSALTVTNDTIRKAMANEAQTYANNAIENIQIGSINIIGRVSMDGQTHLYTNTAAQETLFGEEVRQVTKAKTGFGTLAKVEFNVKKGISYVASVYYKNGTDLPSPTNNPARIIFSQEKDGVETTLKEYKTPPLSTEWAQMAITHIFNEDSSSTNKYYVQVSPHYTISGTTYFSCLKVQEGNKPTEGYEATISDVSEVNASIDAVSGSLDDVSAQLDDAFKDGYFNKTEQKALKASVGELENSYNAFVKEYLDVANSKYLDDVSVTISGTSYTTPKTSLTTKYNALVSAYNNYHGVLQGLCNVKFGTITKPNIGTVAEVSIPNTDSRLTSVGIAFRDTYLAAYTNRVSEYKQALSVAQENIRVNMQKESESYADYISEYEKIKGVNLCSYKKIRDARFTYASALRSDGSFLISHTPFANESYHNGNADIFGMEGQYLANTQYTIRANVLETNATDGKCLYMRFTYSDGSIDWEGGTFNVGENIRTSKAGKTIQKIWGTYSTGSSTRVQVKLEVGATPTTYNIPVEDEVYLAQEKANEANNEKYVQNLLSDSFMLSASSNASQSKIGYLNVFNSSEIIANETYTFSVESSSVSGSGTKPTFYNFGYYDYYSSVFYSIAKLNISNSPQSVQFTMPIGERELEDMSFAIQFNEGKIATSLQHKLFGLMLVKGNTYYKWKPASQAEEESLYMMKDAMTGSTEIEGGLVMTNLIELKNQSGAVTAGISGLSSNKSFTEGGTSGTLDSSLRFWAGANLAGANTAPFRVYNDGRVFGTHFYGFFSAFEVNSSNISSVSSTSGSYKQLNLNVTGSNILLNYSSAYVTLPRDIKYVGSEVQIYNPNRYSIPTCNFVPYYAQCTIKNYEQTVSLTRTSYLGAISVSKSGGVVPTSISVPRWSVQMNSCSNYKPAYVKFRAVKTTLSLVSGYNVYVPYWLKDCLYSGSISNTAEYPFGDSQAYYLVNSTCTFVIWIMVEYSSTMS